MSDLTTQAYSRYLEATREQIRFLEAQVTLLEATLRQIADVEIAYEEMPGAARWALRQINDDEE